ncbi:MAG: helix-turn-helix domain-containing protein [Planctomycetota bacterium]
MGRCGWLGLGLTAQDLATLVVIDHMPAVTIRDLAMEAKITKTTAVKSVRNLKEKGVIKSLGRSRYEVLVPPNGHFRRNKEEAFVPPVVPSPGTNTAFVPPELPPGGTKRTLTSAPPDHLYHNDHVNNGRKGGHGGQGKIFGGDPDPPSESHLEQLTWEARTKDYNRIADVHRNIVKARGVFADRHRDSFAKIQKAMRFSDGQDLWGKMMAGLVRSTFYLGYDEPTEKYKDPYRMSVTRLFQQGTVEKLLAAEESHPEEIRPQLTTSERAERKAEFAKTRREL